MKYVKLFEAWTEEKEEEVSHKDLYEMLEELVDAWKEWKENDDEDADEEELHDTFMEKVKDLVEKAKEIVEEEEEEEEGEEKVKEEGKDEEPKEEFEEEEVEEVEEARDLSRDPGSLTNMLEPLVSTMGEMTLDELKDSFMSILSDPNLKASEKTINKWKMNAAMARSRTALMQTIANIYLRGSGNPVNPSDPLYKGR